MRYFHKVSIKNNAFVRVTDFHRYKMNLTQILSEKNSDRGRKFIRMVLDLRKVGKGWYRRQRIEPINRLVLGFAFASLFRAICLEFRGIPAQKLKSSRLIPRDNPPSEWGGETPGVYRPKGKRYM